MKIINPSFGILPELEHPEQQIEERGGICYARPPKEDLEESREFCKKMFRKGHATVFEMDVLHILITCNSDVMRQFLMTERKYLEVTKRDETLLITASVRGWREYYSNNPTCIVARAAINILAKKYPVLFGDFDPADTFHAKAVLLADSDIEDKFYGKHKWAAVKFTVNRAVSHEIVRHRPCGILQASQRYIRYEDEVTFIKPMFFDKYTGAYTTWETAMLTCESAYQVILKNNSPQAARTVLPNSTATSLIVYANLNEWAHIFKLRTSSAAEPSMREIMVPCYEEFKKRWPEVIK